MAILDGPNYPLTVVVVYQCHQHLQGIFFTTIWCCVARASRYRIGESKCLPMYTYTPYYFVSSLYLKIWVFTFSHSPSPMPIISRHWKRSCGFFWSFTQVATEAYMFDLLMEELQTKSSKSSVCMYVVSACMFWALPQIGARTGQNHRNHPPTPLSSCQNLCVLVTESIRCSYSTVGYSLLTVVFCTPLALWK